MRKLKDGFGDIGKLNWKYWKIELEILENGIRNIGKWNWEYWKMKFKTRP